MEQGFIVLENKSGGIPVMSIRRISMKRGKRNRRKFEGRGKRQKIKGNLT